MKKQVSAPLFAFIALIIASLACGSPSTPPPAPTPLPPTQAPVVLQPTATAEPEQPTAETIQQSADTGGLTDFTDENDLYSIQVPSDWNYSQSTGDNYYIDQFQSPDEQALIENIVYDDGTSFAGGVNGKFALYLLNTFYSSTGKEGDIRISDDSIQKDGSERLTWTSKGGGYSGLSYFEVRNRTTFLMFTVEWAKGADDTYLDTLNQVISSYTVK